MTDFCNLPEDLVAINRLSGSSQSRWWQRLLTTDFCPWANRFVYWLKEPIGWFAIAALFSVLIGLFLAPVGWTLAAALVGIMLVGMVWPWVAVRGCCCQLHPVKSTVHEFEACVMMLTVHNRLPLPLWGLSIEGYLDALRDDSSLTAPTVALACVPPLCIADFRMQTRPPMRGHYPLRPPQIACGFPFGIWTARRLLTDLKTVTVWPQVFTVEPGYNLLGRKAASDGDGGRHGRSGDFLGVRAYQRGDSARHIHWVASARTDSLIVTQRSAPQCAEVDVWLDDSDPVPETLAWKVRVAASLINHLHGIRTPLQVFVGDKRLPHDNAYHGREQLLDALADVPLAGSGCPASPGLRDARRPLIRVHGESGSLVVLVEINDPHGGRRAGGRQRVIQLDGGGDLQSQIGRLWHEVDHVCHVA